MNRLLNFVGIVFVIVLALSSVAIADESPVSVIQGLWTQIQTLDPSQDEASRGEFILSALKENYDFQAFYETALQDHWSTWTDGQKTEFASKFERLFLQSLVGKLKRVPKTGVSLVSEGTTGAGERVMMSFAGKKGEKGAKFKVFFIRRGIDWKIYDVEVEGALLSRNYRGQFNNVLRKENFQGLIARFDAKSSR